MANRYTMKLTMSDQKNSVRLELLLDDEVAAQVDLDAESLDQMIEGLSNYRANLVDQIPHELDPIPRLRTLTDPSWWVFDPAPEGRTVAFRHPGFGWLAFLLHPEVADEIAKYLSKASK